MIIQAALSSVNFGSNPKPSFVKNSIDFFRSRTARLTKIFRGLLSAMVSGLLDPGVEHPAHAEGVGEHAELGAPERVVQGQRDLAVHRKGLELLRHVSDVVEVETDVDVAPWCDRDAGLAVADHDDAFADAQEGVHDAVLVLGGHVHSGNVAEAHEPLGLPAERALVDWMAFAAV